MRLKVTFFVLAFVSVAVVEAWPKLLRGLNAKDAGDHSPADEEHGHYNYDLADAPHPTHVDPSQAQGRTAKLQESSPEGDESAEESSEESGAPEADEQDVDSEESDEEDTTLEEDNVDLEGIMKEIKEDLEQEEKEDEAEGGGKKVTVYTAGFDGENEYHDGGVVVDEEDLDALEEEEEVEELEEEVQDEVSELEAIRKKIKANLMDEDSESDEEYSESMYDEEEPDDSSESMYDEPETRTIDIEQLDAEQVKDLLLDIEKDFEDVGTGLDLLDVSGEEPSFSYDDFEEDGDSDESDEDEQY